MGVQGQDRPVETGLVHWQRDWEAATKTARDSHKPILVLFQEIPGCETCQSFGRQVLADPLMVEAIEDRFVPLLVYNNRQGQDEALLKRFKEPAWNNPVIRLVDVAGNDLIPRADRVWSRGGTALRMISALQAAGAEAPTYLRWLADEQTPTETAVFAMHCFWEGEGKLGALAGVLQTQAGWIDGSEVVTVKYVPEQLDFATLLQEASQMQCTSRVYVTSQPQFEIARARNLPVERISGESAVRAAQPSDRKYYLRNSPYRFLPLSAIQATKLNAALYACRGAADCRQATDLLSPRQRDLMATIKERLQHDPHLLDDLVLPEDRRQFGDYSADLMERISATGR